MIGKLGTWTKASAATTAVALSLGAASVASAVSTSTVGRTVGSFTSGPDAGPPDPAAAGDIPAGTTAATPTPAPTTMPPTTMPPMTVEPLSIAFGPGASTVVANPWLPPRTALPDPAAAPPLAEGDTGPQVLLLERRLAELGYRPGEPDGTFDEATWSAVLAFQKAENLERRGEADTATWQRLADPQAWRPSNSTTYPRLEVDLERQVALVVLGPRHVVTLNTSTGGGYAYLSSHDEWAIAITPTGTWTVYRTYDGTEIAPLGSLYRPMYFHRGFAVHGSPYVPDYPDSHGCVRLSNADMDWLWDRETSELRVSVFDTMDPGSFFRGTGRHGAPARGVGPPAPAVLVAVVPPV